MPLKDVTATVNAYCSKPTEKEKKLAHAVLADPSDIGRAACELVQEYSDKIEKAKEEIKKAASEHEAMKTSYSELRKKYHLATNANAQLRFENARLKKELAAMKKKVEVAATSSVKEVLAPK